MSDPLSRKILSFKTELDKMGCFEDNFPGPNLRNPIHPMFHIDRWMRGYGQNTQAFYHNMTPALQLASLMLTEGFSLWWWSKLFHGSRTKVKMPDATKLEHIQDNPHQFTDEGRRQAKQILINMSEVIVLQFTPERYADTDDGKAWGVTTQADSRSGLPWPWSKHFAKTDYPPIPSKYNTLSSSILPVVALNNDFKKFYEHRYKEQTASQNMRCHFMFAITLVHEIAHALYIYIGHPLSTKEPLWHQNEPKPELGFSWESRIIGRVCDPLFNTIKNCSVLLNVKTYMWKDHEHSKAKQAAQAMKIFHTRSGGIRIREIPVDSELDWIPNHHRRGVMYYGTEIKKGEHFMCIVHGIPMRWVMEWFYEEQWEKKRKIWREYKYPDCAFRTSPKLGPSFTLAYERSAKGKEVMWVSSW